MSDKMDRQEVESVHEHTRESEIECNHRLKDGKSAWRVLLGRCVAQCSICGEENDLNPLCTPELQAPRGFSDEVLAMQVDRTATLKEIAEAFLLEAIRIQAKYLDAGDL